MRVSTFYRFVNVGVLTNNSTVVLVVPAQSVCNARPLSCSTSVARVGAVRPSVCPSVRPIAGPAAVCSTPIFTRLVVDRVRDISVPRAW